MTVEGVTYEVDWRKFRRGASFFIPCLNPKSAKATITDVTKRLRMRVETQVDINEGIRGLRIWRL